MSESDNRPMTVGDWIITLILLAIPLLNIIMLIVWAASGSTNPSKRSYAQANLIVFAVIFCLGILAALILPALAHFAR